MYYCLIFKPQIDLSVINSFKEKYDPYYPEIEAHLTLVFPVLENEISEDMFLEHVHTVLTRFKPFNIRFCGFEKSVDHWLFLSVEEGNNEIIRLHDELYTGPLAKYFRPDLPYSPHISLGLFSSKESGYDLKNPTILPLDQGKYESALAEAESLDMNYKTAFDRVSFIKVESDLKKEIFCKEILL